MKRTTMGHAVLATALLVGGHAAAQNLTIGIGGSPTSLDPHFYNASPNSSLTQHLFDTLVERDAQARLRPVGRHDGGQIKQFGGRNAAFDQCAEEAAELA